MTDPVIDFSDAPAPPPADDASRRRGRPRSPETVRRDEDVLRLLTEHGPLTKQQVVEKTGLKPSLAYLVLWRLRNEGRIERTTGGDARYEWRALA